MLHVPAQAKLQSDLPAKQEGRRRRTPKIIRDFSNRLQKLPIHFIFSGPDTAPTKRSTIARWTIRYVLRRCSLWFFISTIIVIKLRMIIARYSMMNTTSHGMHCDTGNTFSLLVFVPVPLKTFPAIKFSPVCLCLT